MELSQYTKQIGKYISKHVGSAVDFQTTGKDCTIYLKFSDRRGSNTNIEINLTGYADKLRLNVTLIDELGYEKTILQRITPKARLEKTSLQEIGDKLIDSINKAIDKHC